MNTIIFLHGWGVSSEQMHMLSSLCRDAGYTTYAPDLPGFGTAASPEKPWQLDDYVAWLKQYTLSLPKGDGKFILFAHSFGGRIAIQFTAQNPHAVEKLILCGSAGLKQQLTWKRWLIKKIFAMGKWWLRGATWEMAVPWPIRKYIERKLSRLDYFKVSGIMRETFKNVVKKNLQPVLHTITVPTLLVWGREDTMTPLRDGVTMQKEIPNAKLVVIDGANHSLCRTHPNIVVQHIFKFLS